MGKDLSRQVIHKMAGLGWFWDEGETDTQVGIQEILGEEEGVELWKV